MSYDLLLSRLTGLRPVRSPAAGVIRAHRAFCPEHQADGQKRGRSPSLSIAETADGAVLLHCHGGCSTTDVVAAAGLDLVDLFPRRDRTAAAGPRETVAGWHSAAALADAISDAAWRFLFADDSRRVELAHELAQAADCLRAATRAAARRS